MAEYIGRRIVPTHGGVWNETKEYEELVIVLDEESGDSYISRIPVPSGTALDDEEYWMLFSIYSEQIKVALEQVEEMSEEFTEYVNTTATSLTEYVQETATDLTEYVDKTAESLTEKVEEATDLTESNTSSLTERMDTIEARQDANVTASTDSDADYAAEVVDARVSADGLIFDSLFSHFAFFEKMTLTNITPEDMVFTDYKYINYSSGSFVTYTANNRYRATEDYYEFPYSGYTLFLNTSGNGDLAGLAFYDENKKYISGFQYPALDSFATEVYELDCPAGTEYIRLTAFLDADSTDYSYLQIWTNDKEVNEGQIVDGAVSEDKIADGAVTKDKIADGAVTEDKLADDSVTEAKIPDNAVKANHVSFMALDLDYELVDHYYIHKTSGKLTEYYMDEEDYDGDFYATVDYVPFDYAGATIIAHLCMSTSSGDKSGLAFYDEDYAVISTFAFDEDGTSGYQYAELEVPEGTKYMRFTHKANSGYSSDEIGFWYAGGSLPSAFIADAAITEEKIADGAVTEDKLALSSITADKTDFMELDLEYELVDHYYIVKSSGKLAKYYADDESKDGQYYATVDYVPFAYAGSRVIFYLSMGASSGDQSGLAFYDEDYAVIDSYGNPEDGELGFRLITLDIPDGTKYLRFTHRAVSGDSADDIQFWLAGGSVSTDLLADEAVTTEKIESGAVTEEKLSDDLVEELGLLDSLDDPYALLGINVPENPLEKIRENPGYTAIFRTVGCIGDSLASGESCRIKDDGTTGYVDNYEFSWGQYLARMTGNTYYNWSSGGRTVVSWLSSSYATECFDGEHLCDAYIIGLGVNDASKLIATGDLDLGSTDDIDTDDYSNNVESYYGLYGQIIQKIKEVQPKAKIFVLTAPSSTVESKGCNGAVRDLADFFDNVYLVDLYTYGLSLYTTGLMKTFVRSGHYNAPGYYICACIIATYIDWIVKAYPEEFREVEFIGTDYSYYDTDDDDDDEEASG